ncbi:MAG: thiol-disulfide interchange protein, partial [Sphingomonas bacterium]|nr:thiol-disulfide interchange protein [Sphingomonas bacterium]
MIRLALLVRLLVTLIAGLLVVAPAIAAEPTHITPSLVAETPRPAAGSTVTIAIAMRPAPTWHGYWQNPGDSGIETLVEWRLPKGVTAGPLAYPVPGTLVIAGLMNYVYERDYAQLVEFKIPAGLAPGTPLPIRAKLDWLACTDEICVPETGPLAIDLTVGDGTPDPARRADFDGWRAALPRALGSAARFAVAGDKVRIGVPLPASVAAQDAYFFPLTDGAIDYAAPQTVSRSGDMLTIETKAADGAAALKR